MSEHLASRDGTQIAFTRQGSGPAVVLVAAAIQFRGFDPTTVELASQLAAAGFTVVNYDRRGRGETTGATSFTLQDELDDIGALLDHVGGSAALFGSSSGGAICLAAAAAGLPVTRLVLWEVPLDDELGTGGAEFLAGLRQRLDAGDHEGAMAYFMKDMPLEWLAAAKAGPGWPTMVNNAPSLAGDAEALAWTQSAPRAELWAAITEPTTAIVGEETLPFMRTAAEAIAGVLPNGSQLTIPGADHGFDPAVMATTVARLLRS